MTFKALKNQAPVYIKDLLAPYEPNSWESDWWLKSVIKTFLRKAFISGGILYLYSLLQLKMSSILNVIFYSLVKDFEK